MNTDPVKSDPAVVAAEAQRDAAREAYDAVDAVWQQAAGSRAVAEMRGRSSWSQMAALHDAEDRASKVREAAWAKVVRANGEIQQAHAAARYGVALAEHLAAAA